MSSTMCPFCLGDMNGNCMCNIPDDYCEDCGRSPCDGAHNGRQLEIVEPEDVQRHAHMLLSYGERHALLVILELLKKPAIKSALQEKLEQK